VADLHVGGLIDQAKHERTGTELTLHSADLTTHGVIVGMTGSGKTGLGVVLIEEVLRGGIPALLIDPKGDLTNLCLTFPELDAASFRPWVDEGQARAAGLSPDDFAAAQAQLWKDGLAGWGLGSEQITALRGACDFTIYTPGSRSGVGLNIVGSLHVPDTDDAETIADEILGFVSGLLGLVGITADPLSSREHILLSNLVQQAWASQQDLDLPTLVGQVQQPPLQKLGVFEIDEFFPPKDRQQLALKLNGLLASPAFAAWGEGTALDIDALLFTPDDKPRCAIVTTAHLSDDERQFVTSLVLAKLVTWMRRQSGTSDLRVLLYMDEVMGYLPPSAMPPTKKPIMTLMKQARAFGVGVVLATQNPVDIDYKAISNAGTWMIGRLQTERDKDRLLDGMSAAAGGVDVKAVGDTISGLGKREFVIRLADKDRPEVFTSRWAMSYLRGPLTRDQIEQVMGTETATPELPATAVPVSATKDAAPPTSTETPAPPTAAATATDADTTSLMPAVADGVTVRWVATSAAWLADIGGDPAGTVLEPAILARVHLRYDEAKADLIHDVDHHAALFPLDASIDATRSAEVAFADTDLLTAAPAAAVYRLTSAPIGDTTTWKQVERSLIDHLVLTGSLELYFNKELKLYSQPDESAEDFRARCAQAAQAAAEGEKAELATKHAAKVAKLDGQLEAAQDRASVVKEQAADRKRGNLLRAAGDLLGGIFGSRRSAATKIGSAADRLTRTADGERVEEATGKVERLELQRNELDASLAADTTAVDAKWSTAAAAVSTLPVGLERTDVKVTQLLLAWVPVP
jgi:Helicase HerA, central domain